VGGAKSQRPYGRWRLPVEALAPVVVGVRGEEQVEDSQLDDARRRYDHRHAAVTAGGRVALRVAR